MNHISLEIKERQRKEWVIHENEMKQIYEKMSKFWDQIKLWSRQTDKSFNLCITKLKTIEYENCNKRANIFKLHVYG